MNSSQRFFGKLMLLSAPFVAVAIVFFVVTPSPNQSQLDTLQKKIDLLVKNSTDSQSIIIGGDSRAKNDLIPTIFTEQTGKNAVNLAIGVGNLSTFYDALKKNNLLGHKKIFIFSVTSYEINDGYFEYGPSTVQDIQSEPWDIQKISDLKDYGQTFSEYYFSKYKNFLKGNSDPIGNLNLISNGYEPLTGTLETPLLSYTGGTGWDKNFSPGAKVSIFKKAIADLASSGDTIVLYTAPIAPAWITQLKDTAGEQHERFLSDLLKTESQKYPNVHYLDLEWNTVPNLSNENFNDVAHLNNAGATIFTEFLLDRLIRMKLLRPVSAK